MKTTSIIRRTLDLNETQRAALISQLAEVNETLARTEADL